MMNRIEAFEMWCYRRMLKISWTTDQVTNRYCGILKEVEMKTGIFQPYSSRSDVRNITPYHLRVDRGKNSCRKSGSGLVPDGGGLQ